MVLTKVGWEAGGNIDVHLKPQNILLCVELLGLGPEFEPTFKIQSRCRDLGQLILSTRISKCSFCHPNKYACIWEITKLFYLVFPVFHMPPTKLYWQNSNSSMRRTSFLSEPQWWSLLLLFATLLAKWNTRSKYVVDVMGIKKHFLAFLGVYCQDIENLLGMSWIRRVLRGILGVFFGWWCRPGGNPHYYSE